VVPSASSSAGSQPSQRNETTTEPLFGEAEDDDEDELDPTERRVMTETEHAEAVAIQAASMEAAAAAASAPLKHSSELRKAVEARHAEAAALELELQKASEPTKPEDIALEELVGRAVLARNLSASSMLKEWDRNRDGELSRSEFKQAINDLTASYVTRPPTIERIGALFESIDIDGSGKLSTDELKPFLRAFYVQRDGRAQWEERARRRITKCADDATAIHEAAEATFLAEAMELRLKATRTQPPLNVRLGRAIRSKLTSDSGRSPGYSSALDALALQWAAAQHHGDYTCTTLRKHQFRRQLMALKNMGELRIEGVVGEAMAQIDALFDHLVFLQEKEKAELTERLVRAKQWNAGHNSLKAEGVLETSGHGAGVGVGVGAGTGVRRGAVKDESAPFEIHVAETCEGDGDCSLQDDDSDDDDAGQLEIRSTLATLVTGAALQLEEVDEQEEAWKDAVQAAYHLQVDLAVTEAAEKVTAAFEAERASLRAKAAAEKRRSREQRLFEKKREQRRAALARKVAETGAVE